MVQRLVLLECSFVGGISSGKCSGLRVLLGFELAVVSFFFLEILMGFWCWLAGFEWGLIS